MDTTRAQKQSTNFTAVSFMVVESVNLTTEM